MILYVACIAAGLVAGVLMAIQGYSETISDLEAKLINEKKASWEDGHRVATAHWDWKNLQDNNKLKVKVKKMQRRWKQHDCKKAGKKP